MNPGEILMFGLGGLGVLLVARVLFVVLRRRKRWALALSGLLVISYIGFFAYQPYLKAEAHAEKYNEVLAYLAVHYPEREFVVAPQQYEEGVVVGQFDVSDERTPEMGVTLQVGENGKVQQVSNWTSGEFPAQQDVWQELEFHYGENYTLDRERIEIAKQGEWVEGELTVFALAIDQQPAIAVYEYSPAGYGLLDLELAEEGSVVFVEAEGMVFVYVDEGFEGETADIILENGERMSVDASQKGELVVVE